MVRLWKQRIRGVLEALAGREWLFACRLSKFIHFIRLPSLMCYPGDSLGCQASGHGATCQRSTESPTADVVAEGWIATADSAGGANVYSPACAE